MVPVPIRPDTAEVTECACLADSLTSVRFAGDVVMLRCAVHDVQRWVVDGRPAAREDVLPILRGVFGECRGERRTSRNALPLRRRCAPQRTPAGTPDEQLTAVLRARGVPGAWAVA